MTKNLDVVIVRKGNSVVTSGFQCAELLAQLFGLGQNRHIIGCAQGIGLGQHGGEIGILQIQQQRPELQGFNAIKEMIQHLIYKQEGKGNHYTMPIDIVMQENLPYYK